jgi:hypothetical protein
VADLEAALLGAVRLVEGLHLRYAVIGGLALAQWGVARATRDVDFKLAVPDTDYSAVRRAIEAAFPTPGRPGLPPSPLIVSVRVEGVIVDFLLALPGYDSQIVERAVPREVGGREVYFATAEDLVVQKLIAGRERDWLDIESLLESQHGRLDLVFVEDWAAQFAEALDRPEILQRLRALMST